MPWQQAASSKRQRHSHTACALLLLLSSQLKVADSRPHNPRACPFRVPGNTDLWQVTAPYANTQPQLVKVLVRADEGVTGAAAQGVALPVPAAGGSGGGARPAPSPGAARRKPAKAGAAGRGAAGRGGGSRGRGRGRGQGRGSRSRSSTPDAAPKRGRRWVPGDAQGEGAVLLEHQQRR